MLKNLYKFFQKKNNKLSVENFTKIYLDKKFYIFRDLFYKLSICEFDNFTKDKANIIVKEADKEIYFKQLISFYIIKQPLIRIIYSKYKSNNSINFPIPREYQKIITNYGFKVNKYICSFLWYVFVILILFRSIKFIIFYFSANIFSFFRKKKNNINNSLYFVDLINKNLPTDITINRNYNFFLSFSNIFQNINNFYHNIHSSENLFLKNSKVIIKFNNLYPFLNIKNFCKLLIYSFYYFIISLLTLLIGKWWNSLIYLEKIKYLIFKFSDNESIAKQYFFSNSSILFRPLWTYVLKDKSSSASIFFYSLSDDPLCPINNTSNFKYFNNINWPIYYCWDHYHKNKLQNLPYNKNSIFHINGPILFGKNCDFTQKISKKFISIFDIEPHKLDNYLGYSTYNDFGYSININYVKKFISDIIEIAEKFDYLIIHKPKRYDVVNRLKEYQILLNELKKNKNYINIDENYSPAHLINQSIGSISIPFTSTGVLADLLKVKSIYYDPENIIKIASSTSNTPLLSGKDNLYNWIKEL